MDSQVVYPDRIRIRYPTHEQSQFPLASHLDSGAIERWEDETYRKNFASIFEGNWHDWDAWAADYRIDAKTDLYGPVESHVQLGGVFRAGFLSRIPILEKEL